MTIVDAARACLGTPYRHQGRIPGKALDCAGLVVCAVRMAGLDVIDTDGYSMTPCADMLRSVVERNQVSLVGEAHAGDILLMRFGREPQHLAIYTGEDTIIHSYLDVGMVCEHRYAGVWKARTVGVYRLRGAHG